MNINTGGTTMAEKNMIIAMLISLIFTGLGLVYDGLPTRGIVVFGIAILIRILAHFGGTLLSILSIAWLIYALYDTYQCTKAINENQPIPKFLGQYELE